MGLIPREESVLESPIPLCRRMEGEPMVPADRITSFVAMSLWVDAMVGESE